MAGVGFEYPYLQRGFAENQHPVPGHRVDLTHREIGG